MSKRYLITSATPGCKPNTKFLKAMRGYCKKNKAQLLILPTPKLYKNDVLSEDLEEYGKIVVDNHSLNTNLLISNLPINPEQVDPITGLDRLSNLETSVIYASPKQRMKSVASPSSDYPRVLMTPGSCTFPYNKNSKRSLVASKDHVFGAIVVEIENTSTYHYRQIQADGNGSFIDLGIEYACNEETKKAKTAAVVPGDWHTGYTDPNVRAGILEIIEQLNPERLFLHDFFDGISVNHHIEHKYLVKGMMGKKNDLTAELELCSDELKDLASKVREVVIVKSNHDEFLDRWLDEGKYLKDPTNHVIGLELAYAKARGEDPLEYGLKKYNKFKNVTFLATDESFKISKKMIECGQHGHLGPNGARGSAVSIEKSYGQAVMGHCLTKDHSVNVKDRGWVNIVDVQKGDIVLGYNTNGKRNEWINVNDTFKYNYSGLLLNVGSRFWKQTVTDNHFFYTEDGKYINVLDAIKDVPLHLIPIVAAPVVNERDLDISDNLIRLVVAVCADGSFSKHSKEIRFHFKKKRKMDRLTTLFSNEGYNLKFNENSSGTFKVSISKDSDVYLNLIRIINVQDKRLPEDVIRKFSTRQKEILINELEHWDGSIGSSNGRHFSTHKKSEADLIHSVLNELGYRARLLRRKLSGTDKERGYVITYDLSRNNPISKKDSSGCLTKWSVIPEKVENLETYCLATDNSNFWVREETTGTVSLTGNCHSPEILRGTYVVGTSTHLKLNYNKGPSSWLQTCCVVYENGSRQLINFLGNRWHAK